MAVTVGIVLTAGVSFACGPGEEYEEVPAGSQEICVERATGERVEWDKCDDDSGRGHVSYYPWYHGSSHGPAPAVGSKINPAHGSATRPGGTISRPPSSGGFGMSKVSVGG